MWKSLFVRLCLAGAILGYVPSTFTSLAQIQRPADRQVTDKVVISKDEVPLDVVVRDKKGKVIKDLTLADFEVFEKMPAGTYELKITVSGEGVNLSRSRSFTLVD